MTWPRAGPSTSGISPSTRPRNSCTNSFLNADGSVESSWVSIVIEKRLAGFASWSTRRVGRPCRLKNCWMASNWTNASCVSIWTPGSRRDDNSDAGEVVDRFATNSEKITTPVGEDGVELLKKNWINSGNPNNVPLTHDMAGGNFIE